MNDIRPHYIVDDQQKRQSVIVSVTEWEKILEELEELDDIRAYDEARRGPQDAVPFDQAVREIREERQILEDFEAGDFRSVVTPERKAELAAVARATAKKDRRINIRISSRDLASLQRRALEEGVPYQTLVSSILHKYVSGSLYDLTANKAVNTEE